MNLVITEYNSRDICAWYDDKNMIQVDIINNSSNPPVGSIYVGKVKNIVTNLNAVFIDIGLDELCFMQVNERIGKAPAYRRGDELIKLNREDDILVQYVREGIKTKQPAVTTDITLTGRYLIKTNKTDISISSKIKDIQRRKELLSWMSEDNQQSGSINSGYIIRTNAENISKEQLLSEKKLLDSQYSEIIHKSEHAKTYSCIYHAPDGYISAVRDGYIHELEHIITDNVKIYESLSRYIDIIEPSLNEKLVLYNDSYPLSALYSVESNLNNAINKKVWLKSGAYIVIELTEACTVIDVNSGKAVSGKKNKEDTIYKINIEAAAEIVRQLRLRNISGMILVDFIDMEADEHKNNLLAHLKELASNDPIKTTVVDITKLGLIEMTRRKTKKSLYEQLQNH